MKALTCILAQIAATLLFAYLLAVATWLITTLSLHTAQPGGLSLEDILSDCAASALRARTITPWFVPATLIAALMLRDPAEPPAVSNRCPACGYDLRGLPESACCPECGASSGSGLGGPA